MSSLHRMSLAAASVVAALVVSGCTPASTATPDRPTRPATTAAAPTAAFTPTPTPAEPAASSAAPGSQDGTAAAVLATLPVKGRAPMTGYDRDRFGQAWLDADRNGCDTRNDVLAAFLTRVVYEPGTHDCVVDSGDLADPYTATAIHFVYGDGALVDIDHVVALGNVWVTGGFAWPIKKRAAIANDPLNLLPVDASANRQKGDADAATWLPANKSYRCAYVARQVAVKAKYGLWVTAPEKAAMGRVLATCPDQPTPPDSGAPVLVPLNITDPGADVTSAGTTSSSSAGSGESTGGVYYANCDAVRAAGAAPIHRGDPGYGSHLDGDGDGVACE